MPGSDRPPPPGDRRRLDPELAQALDGLSCPPQAGDEALLRRVRDRVLAAIRQEGSTAHRTVRAGEGAWELVRPGIERKLLHDRGGVIAALVRLAPGAVVEAHDHEIDEECLVLEGSLMIGALLLRAGDFHLGLQGVPHERVTTETGALVYLRRAGAGAPATA